MAALEAFVKNVRATYDGDRRHQVEWPRTTVVIGATLQRQESLVLMGQNAGFRPANTRCAPAGASRSFPQTLLLPTTDSWAMVS